MTAKLNEYNQKRNFARTLEPEGLTEMAQKGLRFVVQHHIARRDHYDFRLEWEAALLSWAVPKGPSYDTRDKRLAVRVEEHPLEYRNFEGTIPQGEYGGGVVMLWDEGYWEPNGDVNVGLRAGMLKIVLKGRRLKGKWALVRLKGKAGEKQENWLLLKEKDEYANTGEGMSEFTTSIRTGRTMTEIEEGKDETFTQNPFSSAGAQLAQLVHTVPEGEDWLYELKFDGYRILAYIEGNSVRLITRNGNDYTKRFQEVVSLKPSVAWEGFHDFARRVAEVMEQKWPDRYTSNVRKAKRTGKIFIDWIRNGRGATSIAPYSLRARKGARVSMPIAWDELDTVAPDGVNMVEALRRIGLNDPWNDFFRNNQQLK